MTGRGYVVNTIGKVGTEIVCISTILQRSRSNSAEIAVKGRGGGRVLQPNPLACEFAEALEEGSQVGALHHQHAVGVELCPPPTPAASRGLQFNTQGT